MYIMMLNQSDDYACYKRGMGDYYWSLVSDQSDFGLVHTVTLWALVYLKEMCIYMHPDFYYVRRREEDKTEPVSSS
jgi:hypothetical protein